MSADHESAGRRICALLGLIDSEMSAADCAAVGALADELVASDMAGWRVKMHNVCACLGKGAERAVSDVQIEFLLRMYRHFEVPHTFERAVAVRTIRQQGARPYPEPLTALMGVLGRTVGGASYFDGQFS